MNLRVSCNTAIMQYVFFTLFGQGDDCDLELKSTDQARLLAQLRLSHLTQHYGVRSCCRAPVLLRPLGAACTSLLLCHLQEREGF